MTYRTDSRIGTTIYREGDAQPCVIVVNLPEMEARELAAWIVGALNEPTRKKSLQVRLSALWRSLPSDSRLIVRGLSGELAEELDMITGASE